MKEASSKAQGLFLHLLLFSPLSYEENCSGWGQRVGTPVLQRA